MTSVMKNRNSAQEIFEENELEIYYLFILIMPRIITNIFFSISKVGTPNMYKF